ncbi:asb016 [Agrotis segetum nucleopolyhedrovirus B]|uniref:Asb016 n=1 Tax=Agrotis segetum nucleopolyhedrovirus B TaxID=1580580 RepID=A0A0A7KR09_9ABAC|nr:asb016 [Agrotis segetum nucleopolyhedrovirus B]AIZ48574.1 asb016 [Agrotis segetum nucleopolyhedrovirus B]
MQIICVELPVGWYKTTITTEYSNGVGVENMLAVRKSELDGELHYELCRQWSEREPELWLDLVDCYLNWDKRHKLEDISLSDAARSLKLIDACIRREFGEEVFSQRFIKPWGGQVVRDIEACEDYYNTEELEDPCTYQRYVELPADYDVNRVDYFCKIV